MGQRYSFQIPGDANLLSPNARMHWRSEAALKKRWRSLAFLEVASALNSGAMKPFHGRVSVSFVVRRGRKVDADNASSSGALKALLDGVVEAGLIADDSLLFCERGSVTQETNRKYKERPEVLVTVEEIE